jgi:hypothetical protein
MNIIMVTPFSKQTINACKQWQMMASVSKWMRVQRSGPFIFRDTIDPSESTPEGRYNPGINLVKGW